MAYQAMSLQTRGQESPIPLVIEQFRGCDFRSGETSVDPRRSPDAYNVIAGPNATVLEKRPGYMRLLDNPVDGEVYGIHRMVSNDGSISLLLHAGNRLYRYHGDTRTVETIKVYAEYPYSYYNPVEMNKSRSCAFNINGYLWILDGAHYYRYDGTAIVEVSKIAFVPTTTVGIGAGSTPQPLEAPNLLTGKRINGCIGDGSTREFKLDTDHLDAAIVQCTVNNIVYAEEGSFTVDRTAGKVTFLPEYVPPVSPSGAGITNIFFTFAKTISGDADKIQKCTFYSIFGGENDTRIFVSGNKDFRNQDFQSGLYDPTYFPSTGYTKVGADSSAIMGYVKQYNTQIVMKEGNDQDSTQFLRTFSIDSSGKVSYPLSQGAAGVGAYGKDTFDSLFDDPIFLSRDGIMAVAGTDVDVQRSIQQRSELINPKLINEPELHNAVGIVHKGRYYLFVNSNVYVAESRLKFQDELGQVQYEWYYWTGISANCAMSDGADLYFGKNGQIYRFFREDEPARYLDDGTPFYWQWATPFLYFKKWDKLKNLQSIFITLTPFARSSCNAYLATEDQEPEFVDTITMDTMDFNDFDFTRFSFNGLPYPKVWRLRSKMKKFQLLQLVLRNEDEGYNEGIGLVSLQFNYEYGSDVK